MHYNQPDGFDKCIYTFEEICGKLEACDQGLTDTQRHKCLLNGIKDEDFENIKDNCDKKSFKETVLNLKKKATKLCKIGGTNKQYRRRNNNTTTKQGDRDEGNHQNVKLTNFRSETW